VIREILNSLPVSHAIAILTHRSNNRHIERGTDHGIHDVHANAKEAWGSQASNAGAKP
jgi:hypothetical protein